MKRLVLGTAGHIDHGKTALVKALTGTDTDRLKEEKLRGVTIELGFAHLELPGGLSLGVVDVPGHERFVKHMVAGATSIDLVLMVIAADEGVMPQTGEHLAICGLLGIRHGLVALTKVDMVDEEWLEMVTADVSQQVEGTFLEDAPLVPVSSVTGEGIEELKAEIERVAGAVTERRESGIFRMPIDRVFTMRGFGTVVTGTVTSGTVTVGDTLELLPEGRPVRVRGVQAHGETVETSGAGQRTAINLQGLEKDELERGDQLVTPGVLEPAYMVDCWYHHLPSAAKPLINRRRVRFHSGTSEVLGRVTLLDAEELEPGAGGLVQMRLESPVVAAPGERFVVRSYSPVITVGGGEILHPAPQKHGRFRPRVIEELTTLRDGGPEDKALAHVRGAGFRGLPLKRLAGRLFLGEREVRRMAERFSSQGEIVILEGDDRLLVHRGVVEELKEKAQALLAAYHRDFPLQRGMAREELRGKLLPVEHPRLTGRVVSMLEKEGAVTAQGDLVALAGHRVELAADQDAIRTRLAELYRRGRLTPPTVKEAQEELEISTSSFQDLLKLLVDEEVLVRVNDSLYYHGENMAALTESLVAYLREHGEIDAGGFKDLTGASRKFCIPLLEYFDRQRVTMRLGDVRVLRRED